MIYRVKRRWQIKGQISCIILIFHSDKNKENIKTFLDGEGWTGVQVTQLGWGLGITVSLHSLPLMVDIVLPTMTILTILKDYFDLSNFIF